MTILITGASGFVGNALRSKFQNSGISYITALRRFCNNQNEFKNIVIGEISSQTNWKSALDNVKCVIHLAARVHVMKEISLSPLAEFRRINVEGTRNLAQQAVEAGVKRFIYLSSIKVNGESTPPNTYFSSNDSVNPQDPYGISKWEAEQALHQISAGTGLEVVIIRPPLIYGPNSKGNFASMLKWLRRGVPLPFGNINNQRSLVSLENLCDLILQCTVHPAAAGQTFMVSDNDDLSTTELLTRTASAMGIKPNLFNVPQKLLELSTTLLGQSDLSQRLFGSLQVDISKTRDMLNWKPLISVDEGLKRAVSH